MSARTYLAGEHLHLIDGRRVAAIDGATFDVINPADGSRLATVAKGSDRDISAAVDAARRAFDTGAWTSLGPDERARILWRYADLLEANSDELVELEVLTNGMPQGFAQWGVAASAKWLRHFAGMTSRVQGRNTSAAVSEGGAQYHAYTAQAPIGVVGLIIPWNGPIGSFIIKVAPALASGCTCVVKPAEDTPITALRLAELALEAGVPAGVLNIITGFGDAGAALVAHRGVDKISFTGSTDTGKAVLRASADNLKRVTLELGGKSPCIVFDDANMDKAIPGAAMAIFANTGQVCFAGSRLYIQRKSFERVVQGVADFAQSLKIGSGLDPSNQIGPLISERQRERVCQYITLGEKEGGTIVTGGEPVDSEGFFVQPTVFTNVAGNATIAREEIFGPVVIATPFDELDEVIALANDTNYGLGSGVFTNTLSTAHILARRLNAGNVWVNCYGVMNPTMPFGGFKESGIGHEMGDEGFAAFLQTKSVYMNMD